ncbi:hypothetical protein [Bosea sp. PAMC 26642]|uniref:hypothetical protein n=1 Tax=Bosea sp. (strain PAMC 26642) TaxID=1792307 RepID=UPI00077016A9|nr:hypothetical protein [Bosea sp. PAMC 26642]AMJ60588.1 hypothetical protein AXW83_10065 [Bosea sp. PAMC 26642]
MARHQDIDDMSARERRSVAVRNEAEHQGATVAQQDDEEDWPFLTALFAGLAVAVIVNTFLGLMPG